MQSLTSFRTNRAGAAWAIVLAAALSFYPTVFQAETDPFFRRQPAEIQITNRQDVERLVALGLILDNVTPDRVRAYLDPAEFGRVRSLGLQVRWLPNTAKTRHDRDLARPQPAREEGGYPTYEELTTELQALAAAHPDLCRLVSAGRSVQGRDLWWLKISDNVADEEDEPEFHYIGSMHGDEPVGIVLCLDLARYLLEQYGQDPRVTHLVNETEIWIMPLMNPDGYVAGSRFNANEEDLNRDFPDPVTSPDNVTDDRQPETQAVMRWVKAHTPTLAANLHTGALVAAYPWDHTFDLSPDDSLFVHLATAYTQTNAAMWNSPDFVHGFIQGAYWYIIFRGMMDWAYLWMGCPEITIEVSNDKWPSEGELAALWEDNRESLLAYIEQAQIGVRGLVTDGSTGRPVAATILVANNPIPVFTDPDVGDFHRLLLPGTYALTVKANGYATRIVAGVVVSDGEAAVVDVALTPSGGGGGGGGGGCFVRALGY